ncbi:Tn7 transposase TnsA N-terminal domain-containing protein [Thalassospira sp. SM2505]
MIRLLEFDPAVLRYREQPEPLTYFESGKQRKYTPDFIAQMTRGLTVFEVKPYDQSIMSPLKERLVAFKEHYAAQDIDFVVMTEREIRREPRLSNITKLLRYQREIVSPTNKRIVIDLVDRGDRTLDELFDHLSEHGVPFTNVYALIAQGSLWIDIDLPIDNAEAPVCLRRAL